MTSSETTYHNYKECIARGYKNYFNNVKNELKYNDKNRRNDILFEKIYMMLFLNKEIKIMN